MAWSTSEIADLASTTVNTVRHYHRVGLLAEPDRRLNGYKQYGVRHLVQLLRIRRFVALGLPLAHIPAVEADGEAGHEMLRDLDAELREGIERLERARAGIAAIVHADAPADAPVGFEAVASDLSEAERALLHISGQLLDAHAMADVRRMVVVDDAVEAVGAQIDALAPDADDASRDRLARLLAPILAQNLAAYPWLRDPSAHLSRSARVARQTVSAAVAELCNSAQRDVLVRAGRLACELWELSSETAEAGSPARALAAVR